MWSSLLTNQRINVLVHIVSTNILPIESKKRRQKQPGKLMAKSRSQPVNLPGARPLLNPLPIYWLCIGQHSCCINFHFSLTHVHPLQAKGLKVYSHHCCSVIQWNPNFYRLPWKRKINLKKCEVKMWMSREQTIALKHTFCLLFTGLYV